MLPKVATHILHHTSRAVTAAHNQTGQTIRNVLQLQTQSSTPATTGTGLSSWNGAGSSSWGSGGAGPGGAKFNAGSRFYNGYTGAGRAVTQANSSTANDGTNGQSDDTYDEFTTSLRVPQHPARKSRARSHSMSIEGRQERGEKLGVLKTVQMHARSRHAFATGSSNGEISEATAPEAVSDVSRPVLVRRNSTSAPQVSESFDKLPPPPTSAAPAPQTPPSTDPATPQSTTEPTFQPLPDSDPSDIYLELKHARNSKDAIRVLELVQKMRENPTPPHTAEFNMALEALHETRRAGEPLNILLDTYNAMIKASVVPNTRTYLILILALTDRDHEVHRTIMSLEARSKRRVRSDPVDLLPDQQRIEQLRTENNFGSAMSLFEAAGAIAWNRTIIPLPVYNNLIRSCAYHSNVDAAIHVFAHLEKRSDIPPSAAIFSQLISVYTNIGDLQGAKEVFNEYREAARAGRITWSKSAMGSSAGSNATPALVARTSHLVVWNKMIEAHFRCGEHVGALTLLEQMMDSKPTEQFRPEDVPPPASSTFTQIIAGFIHAGDVPSALNWFNRLLEQDATARHPHESSTIPPKPDQVAWALMLEALAQEEMVVELNKLFAILEQNAGRDGLEVRATDRIMLFEANMRHLEANKDINKKEATQILDFLAKHVLESDESNSPVKIHRWGRKKLTDELIERYIQFGDSLRAFDLLEPFVWAEKENIKKAEKLSHANPKQVKEGMQMLQDTVKAIIPHVLQPELVRDFPISYKDVLRVIRLADAVGFLPGPAIAQYYLYAYAVCKARGEAIELNLRDWESLMYASTALELPHKEQVPLMFHDHVSTAVLLEEMKKFGVDLEKMSHMSVRRITKAVFLNRGIEEQQALFARLGPEYERVLNNPERDVEALRASIQEGTRTISPDAIQVQAPTTPITVDVYHSRYVEEFFPNHPTVSPMLAYSRFEAGVARDVYPIPSCIGRLINALGRLRQMDKVRVLYDAAQLVMSTLEAESHWQSAAWFQIEDQMIIACAHAGEMEAAFEHRSRITAQGGTPSADAYGALIECVKDTTDDTSNAVNLYRESKAVGCTPNVYLFNTIISKLAKARKADFALELFQEMKATNTRPSSITYGAVIAACARVGDALSAEQLFIEMSSQHNFKPRIPPFNTMMQLYAHTKPNRERVIHYYNALLNARIPPSAHTYKLLLDAYGTIEPVDSQSMENVFRELEQNPRVHIQGTHWASLINAYGCVQKNLDMAITVFDSIASHPSSSRSTGPVPDAVTYEALINVLVQHRRMDLVPAYLERLHASGTHLTAYIANLLIKGHAAVGDIVQARSVFESLEDPPQGMAATSNHVPHSPSSSSPTTPTGPCHREPSTWEAMFRAELGSGNRDNALALLERLKARQYPLAVYNRISGIMLNDSVSPWATS